MMRFILNYINKTKPDKSIKTDKGVVKTVDFLEDFIVLKEEKNPTGYLMEVGGERKFIVANNVADAIDRVECLFSGKNWKFIHQSSFDIIYD